MKTQTIIAAALTCCTVAAGAKTPAANRRILTLEAARQVINSGIAPAKGKNSGGTFAVVDAGGNIIALARTDKAFPASGTVATGKARTAALFQKPTKFFEEIVNTGRTSMVALADFTPLQGGVPLVLDGHVVGAVGVSGAASAQEDEEFANTAAAALGSTPAATGDISYIDASSVKAFAKGMPLIEVGEYKPVGDGTLSQGHVFFDMTSEPGEDAIDGVKVDFAGNVYVSGPRGLWVLSPEGTHLGTVVTPKHAHNFAWGDEDGKTLYLCAGAGLYKMRLNIDGVRP